MLAPAGRDVLCYDNSINASHGVSLVNFVNVSSARIADPITWSIPLIITNTSGRIVFANKGVEAQSGFSIAEIYMKQPGELWGGNMRQSFYANMWRTISHKRSVFVAPLTNTTKSGRIYKKRSHIAPVVDSHAARTKPTFFIETLPGVTARFAKTMTQLPLTLAGIVEALPQSELATHAGRFSSQRLLVDYITTELVRPLAQRFSERSNDAMLVRQAQKNSELFTELYNKYFGKVRAYIAHWLKGDWSSAEELTQDVFEKAFRSLRGFTPGPATYRSYLFQIARRTVLTTLRTRDRVLFTDRVPERVSSENTTGRLSVQDVWGALHILTYPEQRVMWMFYREDKSIKDMAFTLKKSDNAIKLHLSRARKKLMQYLDKNP